MSKKLFSLILTTIMLLSMTVVSVQAAVPVVYAGPVTHSADPATADGSITTSVTVYNTAGSTADAALIVATYEGEVLSNVNFAKKRIPAHQGVDFSVTVNKANGETLRYFVWDGFTNLLPIEVETNDVKLNLSEHEYNFKTDGVTPNGMNNAAATADATLRTTFGSSAFTYVDGGLTGKDLTANSWSVEEFDGKTCFSIYAKSGITTSTYGMQCMDRSDYNFKNNEAYDNVSFYVRYYDNSTGTFRIDTSSHNGSKTTGTETMVVNGTGDGKWKIAVFAPEVFGGKTTTNAEFWFTPAASWSEAPLYISEVGYILH